MLMWAMFTYRWKSTKYVYNFKFLGVNTSYNGRTWLVSVTVTPSSRSHSKCIERDVFANQEKSI